MVIGLGVRAVNDGVVDRADNQTNEGADGAEPGEAVEDLCPGWLILKGLAGVSEIFLGGTEDCLAVGILIGLGMVADGGSRFLQRRRCRWSPGSGRLR